MMGKFFNWKNYKIFILEKKNKKYNLLIFNILLTQIIII